MSVVADRMRNAGRDEDDVVPAHDLALALDLHRALAFEHVVDLLLHLVGVRLDVGHRLIGRNAVVDQTRARRLRAAPAAWTARRRSVRGTAATASRRRCGSRRDRGFSSSPSSSPHVLLAEDRLLVRNRRQRPGAGARRPDLGVDVHVDQAGLAERRRRARSAPLKSSRIRDRDALDAAAARPRGEVGVVGLAVRALVEAGADARGRRTCRTGCRGSRPRRSCSTPPTPRECRTRPRCRARAASW